MTRSMDVALTINGEERMLRIEPFETLLTSLRDRLHLTAAKRGCNQGVCGACSVLIGGEPARASIATSPPSRGSRLRSHCRRCRPPW
jgi:aerobic-type carbon monoxide dehydrogenase small subunit (CoxS/CutS family)